MANAEMPIRTDRPHYMIAEFGAVDSVEHWLNSLPDYKLVSMTPISVTNHFSKENETTVWVVIERRDSAA